MAILNTVEDESGYVVGNYTPSMSKTMTTRILVSIEREGHSIDLGETFGNPLSLEEATESLIDELAAAWPILEPKEQSSA